MRIRRTKATQEVMDVHWKKFRATADDASRNAIIENYLSIVKYTAERLHAKLPDEVDVDEEPFLVPLAIPMVAGPSTIAILLLLSSSQPDRLLDWSTALILAWLGTTILLVLSPKLMGLLGTRGSRALERLMGMILVILATQMLLNGVRDFVNSL